MDYINIKLPCTPGEILYLMCPRKIIGKYGKGSSKVGIFKCKVIRITLHGENGKIFKEIDMQSLYESTYFSLNEEDLLKYIYEK